MTKQNKIHFIGICSPVVSSLAVLYKNKGWVVSGSDKDVYPPASTYLEAHSIAILDGFDASRIDTTLALVVVGGGAFIMDKSNPEVLKAQELGIKTVSWPRLVGETLIKKRSIVVAGTWGKTTSTYLIAHTLVSAGFDPTYVIGGFPVNMTDPVHEGDGDISIIEGDEHPSVLYWDDKSKFDYYNPKYLMLTSAKWDHFNVFKTEEEYVARFRSLVAKMPEDAVVFACRTGENIDKVVESAKCRVIYYQKGDYLGHLGVVGEFNRENAAGVYQLCFELGMTKEQIHKAFASFRGVKRRLEKKYEDDSVVIIEDFGQMPEKVKSTLSAISQSYEGYKIVLVFDPHASILRSSNSLALYKDNFSKADRVIVRRVHPSLTKDDRVTGPQIVGVLGESALYVPLDEDIVTEVLKSTKEKKCVVVFCSSGSWDGLIETVMEKIQHAT